MIFIYFYICFLKRQLVFCSFEDIFQCQWWWSKSLIAPVERTHDGDDDDDDDDDDGDDDQSPLILLSLWRGPVMMMTTTTMMMMIKVPYCSAVERDWDPICKSLLFRLEDLQRNRLGKLKSFLSSFETTQRMMSISFQNLHKNYIIWLWLCRATNSFTKSGQLCWFN